MLTAKKFIDSGYEFDPIPKKKSRYKPFAYVCLFLAFIPIISYFVFNGTTLVLAVISMFTDMNANSLETMTWVGFDNFAKLFQDTRFWKSWGVTLILATSQFVTLFIALIIAYLLEQKVKGAKALTVLYFMPYICSSVAVALMWSWVFATNNGILNTIFGQRIEWLDNNDQPWRLIFAVYVTIVWQAPAYGIVMFKAALKNVNPSLYEAASIDGANAFHKFWKVTLPGIKSVLLFLCLASITNGLGVFDNVLILSPLKYGNIAGPNDAALTVQYYIYIVGIKQSEMEYAAVLSLVYFIVVFALTYPVIRARNKESEEA